MIVRIAHTGFRVLLAGTVEGSYTLRVDREPDQSRHSSTVAAHV